MKGAKLKRPKLDQSISEKIKPIRDKFGDISSLLNYINNSILEDEEPWERADHIKALDKIVNEIRVYIKTEFKRELSLRSTRGLPKWITKNQSIMNAIDKTRFKDVWVHIQKHTMPLQRSRVLAKEKRLGKHKEKREYVLFIPDKIDMKNSLNLSESSIQKYLKAFCDSGILKKLGKSGARGKNIYAVGFWSVYGEEGEGGGTRKNYFLKNTKEVRESLKKFMVRT
jgi:hypothetical protein